MLRSTASGFLAHAALLSRDGQGVLICGDPGAGKTTLSVSLLLAGFGYHSDDIVWISEGGEAVGAPFAPAIKAGGWPLLDEMAVGVATSRTYLRSDGQQVRYLSLASVEQTPLPIGSILLLARDDGSAPRVEAVTPLEVLTAVLGSAYAARGAISAAGLKSLADVIGKARIGRLCFSDWRDGRRLVEAFTA
jgi:energy-coupling factor transporter ATP-binding protein EcfA2